MVLFTAETIILNRLSLALEARQIGFWRKLKRRRTVFGIDKKGVWSSAGAVTIKKTQASQLEVPTLPLLAPRLEGVPASTGREGVGTECAEGAMLSYNKYILDYSKRAFIMAPKHKNSKKSDECSDFYFANTTGGENALRSLSAVVAGMGCSREAAGCGHKARAPGDRFAEVFHVFFVTEVAHARASTGLLICSAALSVLLASQTFLVLVSLHWVPYACLIVGTFTSSVRRLLACVFVCCNY